MTQCDAMADDIRKLIDEESRRLVTSTRFDHRVAIYELCRSMDASLLPNRLNAYLSEEDERLSSLVNHGVNKVMSLFLNESITQQGTPLFSSDQVINNWADHVVQQCGKLSQIEFLLELLHKKLVTLKKVGDDYHFQYIARNSGFERIERQDIDWAQSLIYKNQHQTLKDLSNLAPRISSLMKTGVRSWKDDFIAYETTPEIDDFFSKQASLVALRSLGWDAFAPNALFGGIPFSKYCEGVIETIGFRLKHLGFCFELMKKKPNTNFRNVIEMFVTLNDASMYLAAAMNENKDVARLIIETIILNNNNRDFHCKTPGGLASPLYIQIGNEMLLCPIWSALSHPFIFMLNELKRRYRSDWDRNLNRREELFRNDLYRLFNGERFFTVNKSVNIRKGHKVLTDIDAVVFDKQTFTLGLFQLKWQDLFGNSMQERESRKKNFVREGSEWVNKVSDWVEETPQEILLKHLGLSEIGVKTINNIHLFVLGRNFSHFSGQSRPSTRAAWGLWYQVFRLFTECVSFDNPISSLHSCLVNDSPFVKTIVNSNHEVFMLNDIKFVLEAIP